MKTFCIAGLDVDTLIGGGFLTWMNSSSAKPVDLHLYDWTHTDVALIDWRTQTWTIFLYHCTAFLLIS